MSKLFITGCDKNTRWQLPWFEKNFRKHNPDAKLLVYNFDEHFKEASHWFKKPLAMRAASNLAKYVCWIDTDVEIRASYDDIFSYCEPNRLAMVEDKPWSMRRKEIWHNSGVVAFNHKPNILDEWCAAIPSERPTNPMFGDQDVLHMLVRDNMRRRIHITDLPLAYNTLRLNLVDHTAPKVIKGMHWTGKIGNKEIRKQMNE